MYMWMVICKGFSGGSDGKESACQCRDLGSIPGGRNGNPLQYSCLGNTMESGAWWATVHGVTKSQTQLSTHAHMHVSVQFSCSVISDSLRPHELQHTRPPCPSPTPGVYSNSCPSSQWCHPAFSSSVVPFSCPQSLPASGSFPMNQLFAWGGQSIGVSASASVLPRNIRDWFPLGWTSWISLQPKGLSRDFSNTVVKKHQFFSARLSL